MPELPEVETVVRTLAAALPGRRVVEVLGKPVPEACGREIVAVRRYGKFIVLHFADGMLFVHLGMTGQLTLSSEEGKFTRARVVLDKGVLRYDDIRKFGKLFWANEYPGRGPDPLELSEAEFVARLRARRARVKALLLDQQFLRGMGNIYTDETLFRARIHPLATASRLSVPRAAALFHSMREVLGEAIAAGGSSISDYVNAHGEKGSFQERHRVYGRHGKPCPNCGTELRRILVTQRGTTFCPTCQRR